LTRSLPVWKTIGMVEVAGLAASAGAAVPPAAITAATDEIGSQRRQPIISAFRPAILDRDVLALDIAGFSETAAEAERHACARAG
jgi:hypothetical protein